VLTRTRTTSSTLSAPPCALTTCKRGRRGECGSAGAGRGASADHGHCRAVLAVSCPLSRSQGRGQSRAGVARRPAASSAHLRRDHAAHVLLAVGEADLELAARLLDFGQLRSGRGGGLIRAVGGPGCRVRAPGRAPAGRCLARAFRATGSVKSSASLSLETAPGVIMASGLGSVRGACAPGWIDVDLGALRCVRGCVRFSGRARLQV
jgi:hypothetical protein